MIQRLVVQVTMENLAQMLEDSKNKKDNGQTGVIASSEITQEAPVSTVRYLLRKHNVRRLSEVEQTL